MNYVSVVFSSGSSTFKLPLFSENGVHILPSCIAKGTPFSCKAESKSKVFTFFFYCRLVIQQNARVNKVNTYL